MVPGDGKYVRRVVFTSLSALRWDNTFDLHLPENVLRSQYAWSRWCLRLLQVGRARGRTEGLVRLCNLGAVRRTRSDVRVDGGHAGSVLTLIGVDSHPKLSGCIGCGQVLLSCQRSDLEVDVSDGW